MALKPVQEILDEIYSGVPTFTSGGVPTPDNAQAPLPSLSEMPKSQGGVRVEDYAQTPAPTLTPSTGISPATARVQSILDEVQGPSPTGGIPTDRNLPSMLPPKVTPTLPEEPVSTAGELGKSLSRAYTGTKELFYRSGRVLNPMERAYDPTGIMSKNIEEAQREQQANAPSPGVEKSCHLLKWATETIESMGPSLAAGLPVYLASLALGGPIGGLAAFAIGAGAVRSFYHSTIE